MFETTALKSRLFRRFLGTCICSLTVAGVAAQDLRIEPVARKLDSPWAVAFLPDGRFLVTERPGKMRVIEADGTAGAPLAGVPEVVARGQGGLLDVVLDSDFARTRVLYFCFSEPGTGGNSTALARARLAADRSRLEEVRVIFSQKPKFASNAH
ncbi:MAG: PQQ-dependent sugar dehydrogenase, partial [Burkholderiales bacterium]